MLYKVEISSETAENADDILNGLLEHELATGGQVVKAPARFRWKGDIVEMEYFTINSFTIDEHRAQIIELVESLSTEEVPMVTFLSIEVNEKLDKWVRSTVRSASAEN